MRFALLTAGVLSIGAFATLQIRADDDHALPKPSTSPAFEVMKKLVGEWAQTDDKGKAGPVVTVYKLISNGSVLHETLFPGTQHEMVSVYHMDGPDLICTHYCAMGNQPRLKYVAGKDPKVLEFKSVAVGNGKSLNDAHMGHAMFRIIDDNHVRTEWQSLVNQKPDPSHAAKFDLVRKSK